MKMKPYRHSITSVHMKIISKCKNGSPSYSSSFQSTVRLCFFCIVWTTKINIHSRNVRKQAEQKEICIAISELKLVILVALFVSVIVYIVLAYVLAKYCSECQLPDQHHFNGQMWVVVRVQKWQMISNVGRCTRYKRKQVEERKICTYLFGTRNGSATDALFPYQSTAAAAAVSQPMK